MKQCLEQGTGVLLCILLPAAGAVIKLVLFGYYTWLERACQKINETENRQIHSFIAELRHRKKNGIGAGTEGSYTVFYLSNGSVAGIPVQTLERIGGHSALLSLLVCGILAFAGVYYDCDSKRIIGLLFLGVTAVTGLLLLDLFFGVEEKKKRIRFCMEDYERYFLAGNEEPVPAEVVGRVKKEGRAQEEKRRLTEELLRERRQLSARQYMEDTANTDAADSDAEPETAAATTGEEKTSPQNDTEKYEKMLRSVLAEFLS